MTPLDLVPLGEQGWLARFPDESSARRWHRSATESSAQVPGVVEIVLAYRTVAVLFDLRRVDAEAVRACLLGLHGNGAESSEGRLIHLPVLYDGEDLRAVAESLGLSERTVMEAHSGKVYDVFALGFRPGFPYAGYLPECLCGLPRRLRPRAVVPAGSVAIVGRQTGVYPDASPGGWHLIGRTPLRIVDVDSGHFPIRAGDQVQFAAIEAEEFEAVRGSLLMVPGR